MVGEEPRIMPGGPVITIGGLHGVGKSTHSELLSKLLGLEYVSTGLIFRDLAKQRGLSLIELTKVSAEDRSIDLQIDNLSKERLMKGGIVFDSLLAPHLSVGFEALRIYLFAPIEVRMARIAEREKRNLDEIWQETLFREKLEIQRFKEYYDIDMSDTSAYHLLLDTSLMRIDDNVKILMEASKVYIERRWPNWR